MDPSTPYGPLSLNLAVLELEVYFSAVPPRISLILSERLDHFAVGLYFNFVYFSCLSIGFMSFFTIPVMIANTQVLVQEQRIRNIFLFFLVSGGNRFQPK